MLSIRERWSFFGSGGDVPRYVHILSRHYEPLQYPLLFPHGTPGWGFSSTFPFPERIYERDGPDLLGDLTCRYTQIQWSRHLLLVEPRFLLLGRLTCEYLDPRRGGLWRRRDLRIPTDLLPLG